MSNTHGLKLYFNNGFLLKKNKKKKTITRRKAKQYLKRIKF